VEVIGSSPVSPTSRTRSDGPGSLLSGDGREPWVDLLSCVQEFWSGCSDRATVLWLLVILRFVTTHPEWWSTPFVCPLNETCGVLTSVRSMEPIEGVSETVSTGISEQIRLEAAEALKVDDTRLGEVWRYLQEGKSDHEIAAVYNTKFPNWVWSIRRYLKVIEGGPLPSAPTVARSSSLYLSGFLKRHSTRLSPEVLAELESRLGQLKRLQVTTEGDGHEPVTEIVREREEEILKKKVVGVYVYTLPHYLAHPVSPADEDTLSDRTLFKVGKSDNDVIRRFNEQQRITALPEKPLLVRIYTGIEDKGNVESRFHALLSAADHRRNQGRAAGTEWFLTSLRFLDAIAEDMGLTLFMAISDDE
jgi:hypothetical protein